MEECGRAGIRVIMITGDQPVPARLWHMFNMRDPGTSFLLNEVTTNPYVWGALAVGGGLLAIGLFIPQLAAVLGLTPPAADAWLLITAGSLTPLVAGQAVKLRSRWRH